LKDTIHQTISRAQNSVIEQRIYLYLKHLRRYTEPEPVAQPTELKVIVPDSLEAEELSEDDDEKEDSQSKTVIEIAKDEEDEHNSEDDFAFEFE